MSRRLADVRSKVVFAALRRLQFDVQIKTYVTGSCAAVCRAGGNSSHRVFGTPFSRAYTPVCRVTSSGFWTLVVVLDSSEARAILPTRGPMTAWESLCNYAKASQRLRS